MTLSTLLALADESGTGSVTIIRCGDRTVWEIESTDTERAAVGGGDEERSS